MRSFNVPVKGYHSNVKATRPPFLAYANLASASIAGHQQESERSRSNGASCSTDSTGSTTVSRSRSSCSCSCYNNATASSLSSLTASSDLSTSSSVDSTPNEELSPPSSPPPPKTAHALSPSDEDLHQLVYTSSSRNRYLTSESLQSILRSSRQRNREHNITGLLLYRDGSFAQFLEGPSAAVRSTFAKIEKDTRHRGVIVILQRRIKTRDFGSWRMGFCDLDYTLPAENIDEHKGQVGKRGATLLDAEALDQALTCLVDLTSAEPHDLTHNEMSGSVRTLLRVFHSSLARST